MAETIDNPEYGVAQFYDDEAGLTVVLTDERMADPDEHPAAGAIAYTAELYAEPPERADPLLSTAYTVGPRHEPQADAKGALFSLAGDALAARTAAAPRSGDPLDITREEVRDAIEEYARHYGDDDTARVLEHYAAAVEARDAFREAHADPGDLYDRLDN